MDPPSDCPASRPPCFVQPPSPSSHSSLVNEASLNHEFILQCINKQRVSTYGQVDVDEDINSRCSEYCTNTGDVQYPLKQRARLSHTRRRSVDLATLKGILRNPTTLRRCPFDACSFTSQEFNEDAWLTITTQNNNANHAAQDKWRRISAIPIDLSRENRSRHCSRITDTWISRYGTFPTFTSSNAEETFKYKRVQFSSPRQFPTPDPDAETADLLPILSADNSPVVALRNKRPLECPVNVVPKAASQASLLTDIKANLHSRAERKITRIATWNINNGFDHLAIASIMAKHDIDVLALQEPRISVSTKDDVWISTMRKELRKCKYELITSQFSYIIFDEQTSGAALASVVRQVSKVHGRLFSVTFTSNDVWEVHTIISIYAVTNAKSTKKYANSRKS